MAEARRYRKKPVVVHAVRFDGTNAEDVFLWANGCHPEDDEMWKEDGSIYLMTPSHTGEPLMRLGPGDWVVRAADGEFYPCSPDIFEATYEPVDG